MCAAPAMGHELPEVATLKDQQRFNQWLKYHCKSGTHKADEVKKLAELYRQCNTPEAKKAFIGRWLHAGGSKGDVKGLIEQELVIQAQSQKLTTDGYMTPGAIAELLKIQCCFYPNVELFENALRKEIAINQQQHPPPDDIPVLEAGDFWTSKYHFKHTGASVRTDSTITKDSMSKYTNVQLGNSTSSVSLATSTAMSIIDVEQKPEIEDADQKAKKVEARQQAHLSKRTKIAAKQFMSLVQLKYLPGKPSIIQFSGDFGRFQVKKEDEPPFPRSRKTQRQIPKTTPKSTNKTADKEPKTHQKTPPKVRTRYRFVIAFCPQKRYPCYRFCDNTGPFHCFSTTRK